MGATVRRVGVAGLGRMGLRMARRLAAAGFEVWGHDPDAGACAAAADAGLALAPSNAALAANRELVLVMVGFEGEVDAVLFTQGGVVEGAAPGTIVAVAATVAPSYMAALPARAPGLVFLDIPVARGEVAAERGDLLLFAGGEGEVLARCRPVLDSFASDIHHLGPLGAGQVAKAVNNMLLWACLTASVEGLDFGAALGVDREALRAALLHSSGANWALETRADERPALWAEKDMMTLLAEADRARIAMPVAGTVKEAVKAFKIARGLPMPSG